MIERLPAPDLIIKLAVRCCALLIHFVIPRWSQAVVVTSLPNDLQIGPRTSALLLK